MAWHRNSQVAEWKRLKLRIRLSNIGHFIQLPWSTVHFNVGGGVRERGTNDTCEHGNHQNARHQHLNATTVNTIRSVFNI